MVVFDRIEDKRIYLGFTMKELRELITHLEQTTPDNDVVKRLNDLYTALPREI